MLKQYPREELWKLYQKLPKELQEAIFAGETADHIGNICERYKIKDEIISEIAKQVGNVLMGLLPPEEFQEVLETELALEGEIAKKVSFEINRYIFRPVKESLKLLYEEERPEKEKMPEEKEKKPKKRDTYREPIE